MTRRLRIPQLAVLLGALAAAPAAAQAGDLTVRVEGLRNDDGSVFLCVWASGEGFPNCDKGQLIEQRKVPAGAADEPLVFRGVPAGTLAVTLLHDENGNNKIDTVLSIPREGYGISNNKIPRLGPPRFADAAFPFDGTEATISITVRYP